MKQLMIILFTILSFTSYSQTIKPEQAIDSVGKTVTVCGVVTGTHSSEKVTLLNMGGKYPNNTFTVVIFADDAAKFSYKLSTLEDSDICVTGLVKDFKGVAEIVVSKEADIKVQPAAVKPRE